MQKRKDWKQMLIMFHEIGIHGKVLSLKTQIHATSEKEKILVKRGGLDCIFLCNFFEKFLYTKF